MFTVKIDHEITRRLRVHRIFDENKKHRSDHMLFSDVLKWLVDNDIRTAMFTDGTTAWMMEFEPRPW